MMSSLFTGVSGMYAHGTALSVIGDNVANMNTVGFKSSRAAFGDILSQQVGHSQVGRGVQLTDVSPIFTQGAFENTSNVFDMAVDGDGLFMINDGGGAFYTRQGQFNVDKNGDVVNPSGHQLQGYLYNTTGTQTNVIGDINVAAINSPPNPTLNVSLTSNLDSRETIPAAFDVNNPDSTSNYSSSLTVYDSLGNGHVIELYFRKSAVAATGNTWEWFSVVNGNDSASAATEIQAQGTLGFDNSGRLDTESAVAYPLASGGFDFNGLAAPGQAIDFDFGTSITTDGGSGLDGATQYGNDSSTAFQDQDGYSSGSMMEITIGPDGIITGIFTNGQTRGIAQVAIAKFISPTGLTKVGKGLYAESVESGQALIGTPGTSGTGQVIANSLEMSNVDLAEEFVKMIMAQRGFQANSRVISTSDELLVELVNLKR